VLPEADEFDVELKDTDIRKDTFCSSGPGGQSVNTTYSAVRLTHIPTGTIATCQDQKSQLKNYDKALKVLRTRLYEIELQKRLEKETSMRRGMVSTGDRSAKIRTYNFPQGRLTDHRINFTSYNLLEYLNGNIGEIIEALRVADNAKRLHEGYNKKRINLPVCKSDIIDAIKRKKSFLCIGLDSDFSLLPQHLLKEKNPVLSFNKSIIDATSEFAVAYKPNLSFL